jgi:hypothetical protein
MVRENSLEVGRDPKWILINVSNQRLGFDVGDVFGNRGLAMLQLGFPFGRILCGISLRK